VLEDGLLDGQASLGEELKISVVEAEREGILPVVVLDKLEGLLLVEDDPATRLSVEGEAEEVGRLVVQVGGLDVEREVGEQVVEIGRPVVALAGEVQPRRTQAQRRSAARAAGSLRRA